MKSSVDAEIMYVVIMAFRLLAMVTSFWQDVIIVFCVARVFLLFFAKFLLLFGIRYLL